MNSGKTPVNVYEDITQRRRDMYHYRRIFWTSLAALGLLGAAACLVILLITGTIQHTVARLSAVEFILLILIVIASLIFFVVGLWSAWRTPPPPPVQPPDRPFHQQF